MHEDEDCFVVVGKGVVPYRQAKKSTRPDRLIV